MQQQQQQDQQSQYYNYLIKTPKYIENKNSDSTVIGVIDSSGSMRNVWKHVSHCWNEYIVKSNDQSKHLITFSSRAKYIFNSNNMGDSIDQYGGYKTNIAAAFEMLNEKIKLDISQKKITVVFVSDGADSQPEQLNQKLKEIEIEALKNQKIINFISVAVGSNFPTFIAMRLRDMYHSGDKNVPPVYLIDEIQNEQVWNQNFQQISQYMDHQSNLQLLTPVKQFPWSQELEQETFENTWVLAKENSLVIQHKNQKTEEIKISQISLLDMIQILTQWINNLQLESLKQKVQQKAQFALNLVKQWQAGNHPQSPQENQQNQQNQQQQQQVIGGKQKISFHQKMIKKCGKDMEVQFNQLLKELQGLSEKNILENLSETEAAKRLAIGTQMGRYHNKALEMRGISVDDYQSALQQFIQIYQSNKISEESDQDFSVISMQNMKDVLLEPDFIEGLKLCPSQYDLVENLPLIGHALKIQRSNGSMINPYMVKVISMAKHHQIIDTMSIQSANENLLVLKTGNDETEEVNAVIPLFGPRDADLQPILNSQLFNILMTFNVMQNADTLFPNAYIALLCNTFLYLITCEKDNQWRQDNLKSLLFTVKMVYSEQKWFKIYCDCLLNTPEIAVVTESPSIETKCEDLAKPIFILYYLQQEQKISEEKVKHILTTIYKDLYGRQVPQDAEIFDFYDLENENDKKNPEEVANKINNNFPDINTFQNSQQLASYINDQVSIKFKDIKKSVFKFNIKKVQELYYMNSETHSKFTFAKLDAIQNFFLPKQQQQINSQKNIQIWVHHAIAHRHCTSLFTNQNKCQENIDTLQNDISEQNFKIQQRETYQKIRQHYAFSFSQARNHCTRKFKYIKNCEQALFFQFLKFKAMEELVNK